MKIAVTFVTAIFALGKPVILLGVVPYLAFSQFDTTEIDRFTPEKRASVVLKHEFELFDTTKWQSKFLI